VLKTGEKVLIQHEESHQSGDTSEEGEWEDDTDEGDEAWNEREKKKSRGTSENAKAAFPLVMRPPESGDSSESSEVSQDEETGGSDTSESESQPSSHDRETGK
jgi:hypothetical protein